MLRVLMVFSAVPLLKLQQCITTFDPSVQDYRTQIPPTPMMQSDLETTVLHLHGIS